MNAIASFDIVLYSLQQGKVAYHGTLQSVGFSDGIMNPNTRHEAALGHESVTRATCVRS